MVDSEFNLGSNDKLNQIPSMRSFYQENVEEDPFESWVENESWNIRAQPFYPQVITSTYYVCTTFSTVGFGDLHPINAAERIVIAFMMYFGQAFFGYICSHLLRILDEIYADK